MRRLLFSLLAAGLLASNTGCYCLHQFLCCAKQRFCCCNDPVCGPPCKVSCPTTCGPSHCAPACADGGCGELYMGDIASIPAGKHQPCNSCGEWVGKSYPQMPAYSQPKNVVVGGVKPVPHTAGQPAKLKPTPAPQPYHR